MSKANSPVVVVGAGPTGLAAALLLARRGIAVRIIDASMVPSGHSKALAVNPRTLELLAGTGVDERIVAEGTRMTHAELARAGSPPHRIDLAEACPGGYLVALPQSRTEALLAEALAGQGVQVQRGVTLERLTQRPSRVELNLLHADGWTEHATVPLVFGADGARSRVRDALKLAFPGSKLPEPWKLWDLELDTDLAPDTAHLLLRPDGLVFVLRVEPERWRVIGNGAAPLEHLPGRTRPGPVHWESSFRIAHRVVARAAVGRVALGGDAAHVHSPLGARGMNLGIEDACVFAVCAADMLAGRLSRIDDYGALRHAVHRELVRRIAWMTRLMRGRPPPVRWRRGCRSCPPPAPCWRTRSLAWTIRCAPRADRPAQRAGRSARYARSLGHGGIVASPHEPLARG